MPDEPIITETKGQDGRADPVADEEHPDYLSGTFLHDDPRGDMADMHALEDGETLERTARTPFDVTPPAIPLPRPFPRPFPPVPVCTTVSGRYRYWPRQPNPPAHPVRPGRPPILSGPVIPINLLTITVRVDVDRFFPQNRISLEVQRLLPNKRAHAIAEVRSDRCLGFNRRTIVATIVYRDGDPALIPGTTVTFRAMPGRGYAYGTCALELSGGGISPRKYDLVFESPHFDAVEFEVDRVENSGPIVAAYDTTAHPTRPADLPAETLTLASVFERAGFKVSMSPHTTVIPISGAGANGTWSDTEMHNAMVTYWSRFANKPQWAMWVLYAARHDIGRSLGGVMFDDIGPNHRQGTAIFTDSFIQDVPPGDPAAQAWRDRMQFWTAVHEMGHAFNLAHSWQKSLGVPQGAPGDPWIPLANEPEARSFMNYPFAVAGGQGAFFGDFRFRFSDDELLFMRHAPRRFVQMGNSNWFENHGFEAPDAMLLTGNWKLELRANRDTNAYAFLEPCICECKLTCTASEPATVDADLLEDGRHIMLFVQRENGPTRQWRAMVTHCHERHLRQLAPGESLYGAHMISASGEGWLIDEPGFYKVQAAVDMGAEIVVSNVMRIYVAPPVDAEEVRVAPDYFTEEVGRTVAFTGAPSLDAAEDVLKRVMATCANNPAAKHAEVALSAPKLRYFKVLEVRGGAEDLRIDALKPEPEAAADMQEEALLAEPHAAADTIGHIPYFDQLREVADALEDHGDVERASRIMRRSIALMKERHIKPEVVAEAEARLDRGSDLA